MESYDRYVSLIDFFFLDKEINQYKICQPCISIMYRIEKAAKSNSKQLDEKSHRIALILGIEKKIIAQPHPRKWICRYVRSPRYVYVQQTLEIEKKKVIRGQRAYNLLLDDDRCFFFFVVFSNFFEKILDFSDTSMKIDQNE